MKKAFDQTVRDLKREVNKKVLKVSGIEQKILDATNNEPWGPHGSHLSDIAQATRNIHEYHMIMTVIWKRINDTGKNWRHVYKALTVLEYLVVHGSERVIDEIREHAYQISTLSSFQYIDSSGKDQGSNVRRKSQNIVSLVNNKERVYEVRQKALANQDKHRSTQSTGRSSYPSPGGSDDRYDDDRYKVHGRDEERYSDRRERESGYRDVDRYERNGDTYSQEGDGYVRDSDERYGRGNNATGNYQMGSRNRSINGDNSFHDDDHYSSRTDDPLQDERSSEQSLGAPPSYEEATRDSQGLAEEGRNGGNIADSAAEESTLNKGPLGSKSQDPGSPAAFVFTPVQNLEHNCFDAFDPRESVSVAPPAADHLGPPSVNGLDVDIFGSLSSPDLIYSLDAMPATSTDARVEATVPGNAAIGSEFCTYSLDPTSASNMFNQPSGNPFGDPPFEANQETFPAQQESFAPLPSFEPSIPSGSSGVPSVLANVEAIAGFDLDSFGSANYVPFSTDGSGTLQSVTSNIEADMTFGFEDSFDGTNYTPLSTIQHNNVTHRTKFPLELPANQLSHDISSLLAPQLSHDISSVLAPQNGPAAFFHSQAVQPTASAHTEANFLQSPQLAPFTSRAAQVTLQGASPSSSGIQSTPLNLLSQQGGSPAPIIEGNTTMPTLSPAKNPSVDKFETKSTVWADTLRRGLVNLNISGPKTNPHADIGIDFDSMNRKEKRNEEKKSSAAPVVSNITMGKAMGSGSGIGRAGAGGLAAPPNHMMGSNMGMGMNIAGNPVMGIGSGMGIYGGSMNQPLGMGMGMNMGIRTSMGMNMGMNQGMPMNPPMGMPPGGAGMMPGMPPGGASMMPGMSNGGPGMMLGAGYNGMMTGTGSYNFQHPYGGGYGQGN